MSSRWLAGAVFCFNFALSAAAASSPKPPRIVLWSWLADDDFRFLKDPDVGIAYLALSIRLEGRDAVIPLPRAIPVRIAPTTWRMAVIRLDYDSWNTARTPAFTPQQRQLAAKMVAEIAELAHAQAIQIDFDAVRAAYPFYRQLLTDLRERLGPKVFLSITALVDWCESNRSWLEGLPVDEIVPMAFYMGHASAAITTKLQRGGEFVFPACRHSIGVRLGDGNSIRPHKDQRAYFFAPPSRAHWSSEDVKAAKATILP